MDYLYRMREREESMMSPKSLELKERRKSFAFTIHWINTDRDEGNGNLELEHLT